MKARIASLILVAMAIVSFVLAMLAMFAGHTKGFMEDYAIVRVGLARQAEMAALTYAVEYIHGRPQFRRRAPEEQ